MSIDFATLQGLSIPEGVVTQIADASGRVLWSAEKVALGTWYLRPNADISVGHSYSRDGTIVAYPDTHTSPGERPVYVFINEEVSDEDSTYLEAGGFYGGVLYSKFDMSGDVTSPLKSVVKSVLGVSAYATVTDNDDTYREYAKLSVIVCVDETEIEIAVPVSATYELFEIESGEVTAAINKFIANDNGNIPHITITIKTENNAFDVSTKDASTVRMSQVYLALTGEYVV